MFGGMFDYVPVGSVGFAQLGQPDYEVKREVENAVMQELINSIEVPDEFRGIANLRIKTFQYEYDSYDEVVVSYMCKPVERWEWEDEDKYDRFWAWVNEMEDLDIEALEDKCWENYRASMRVAHKQEEFTGLKKLAI